MGGSPTAFWYLRARIGRCVTRDAFSKSIPGEWSAIWYGSGGKHDAGIMYIEHLWSVISYNVTVMSSVRSLSQRHGENGSSVEERLPELFTTIAHGWTHGHRWSKENRNDLTGCQHQSVSICLCWKACTKHSGTEKTYAKTSTLTWIYQQWSWATSSSTTPKRASSWTIRKRST